MNLCVRILPVIIIQIAHSLAMISYFYFNIHNYFASYCKTGLSQRYVIEYGSWSDIISIGGLYTAYGIRASYNYNYRLYKNTASLPSLRCFLFIFSVQQLVYHYAVHYYTYYCIGRYYYRYILL